MASYPFLIISTGKKSGSQFSFMIYIKMAYLYFLRTIFALNINWFENFFLTNLCKENMFTYITYPCINDTYRLSLMMSMNIYFYFSWLSPSAGILTRRIISMFLKQNQFDPLIQVYLSYIQYVLVSICVNSIVLTFLCFH